MAEENYLKEELYSLISSNPEIFDFICESSLDGIWYWDVVEGNNEWMSPELWHLLGYDPADKAHLVTEWQELINQDDLKLATKNFLLHCEDPNHKYDQEVRYKHKNGTTVWVRCRGKAIRDENGKVIRLFGAHTDITELKRTQLELERKNEQLQHMVTHDNLTGLLNRKGLSDCLSDALKKTGCDRAMIGMAVIDVDNFKVINDTYGHVHGDRVLTLVAQTLKNSVRDTDYLSRFAGDEFALLMLDKSEGCFLKILERAKSAISANAELRKMHVTVSVGISYFLLEEIKILSTSSEAIDPAPVLKSLIYRADQAMYESKRIGRDTITVSN
ncbi:sensor domain-containing diguanylate cyclase [Thaumasiovibrio subtropicus]|uniref:sensor domain-containing diguanylate cyclase n=1 Tax=Thaumasiovibrio subtropicus TaxID=1891207 RepID=UPI000B35192C|nr:diguanylate cyclase [Thaumasiovibrio subtropicus]